MCHCFPECTAHYTTAFGHEEVGSHSSRPENLGCLVGPIERLLAQHTSTTKILSPFHCNGPMRARSLLRIVAVIDEHGVSCTLTYIIIINRTGTVLRT